MNRIKKIAVGVIICSASMVIMIFSAAFFMPKLIEITAVRKWVRRELKETVSGEIDFKRIGFSFFPAPHVLLYEFSLVLPARLSATAEAINVYPEFLPLLSWKFNIKELSIHQPELSIFLKNISKKEDASGKPKTVGDIAQEISAFAAALFEYKIPDVKSHLRNGRIKMMYGKKQVVEFHRIEGHITNLSNRAEFQVTGASGICKTVWVSGWMNTRQMKSSMRFALTELRTEDVYNALFPDAAMKIEDARTDLTIDFNLDGSSRIQTDIDLSMPQLALIHKVEPVSIQNGELKGKIHIDKDRATVSLSELVLASPKMQFSGHLISSLEDPRLRLQLEGRDIDLEATRQAALAIFGGHDVVRDISGILKKGTLSLLTMETQGSSPRDLINLDNLTIRGKVRNGEIHVPGVPSDLKETSGDMVISNGILRAVNIEARLENSSIQNGKFTLGLQGGAEPFHLETNFRADLSDLPPILRRLIDHTGFQKELALLKEVKGNANGKLVLGEDTRNVKTTMEVSDVHLTALYSRIPFPVEIKSGHFSYADDRVRLSRVRGRMGRSFFSEIAAALDLRERPSFEITSGESDLFLSEIAPWLASFDTFRSLSTYYGGGKSSIRLSTINVKGPLSAPRQWQFTVKGAVEDLSLKNLPDHPAPVTIASGKFTLDPQTLSYSDAKMTMLDGTLKISGTHKQYLKGIEKNARLTFEGRMGPKYIQWISNLIHMPTWMELQPLSLSSSQVSWNTNGKTTVSGNLAVLSGPKITWEALWGADEQVIEKLALQDDTSLAVFGLTLKDTLIYLSFEGNLHRSTLDKVLKNNNIPAGRIEGNIRARISRADPFNSSFAGKLKGHALSVPIPGKTPLKIASFSVNGANHKLFIESADMTWMDMPLSMSGKVQFGAKDRGSVDLNLSAGRVDLDHLLRALKKNDENKEQSLTSGFSSLPVLGNIRFKADRFTFRKAVWSPVNADISIKSDSVDVTIKEAAICGMSTPGALKITPLVLEFDLEPTAQGKNLKAPLNCFAAETFRADGKYSLTGILRGRGTGKDWLKSLTGHVNFVAEDGHIYHDIVLLNVIKFLNVTEKFTGHITAEKMEKVGFGYHTLRIEADLRDGKILYKKAVLDGYPMTIAAHGEYNFRDGQIDLTMLLAPLKTMDRVLGHVPLVGGILQTLDTIPLSVKGSLRDVKVLPLTPSAVAYELKELIEKTADVPIKLLHFDDYRKVKGDRR